MPFPWKEILLLSVLFDARSKIFSMTFGCDLSAITLYESCSSTVFIFKKIPCTSRSGILGRVAHSIYPQIDRFPLTRDKIVFSIRYRSRLRRLFILAGIRKKKSNRRSPFVSFINNSRTIPEWIVTETEKENAFSLKWGACGNILAS